MYLPAVVWAGFVLYIGGRQVRPDQGYSLMAHDAKGRPVAEYPMGARKDIRDAVEAARFGFSASSGTR